MSPRGTDVALKAVPKAHCKCPREQLLLLCIETRLTCDIIGRILKQLSEKKAVPVDLVIDRGSKTQWIGILLDREAFIPSPRLLAELERDYAVISAEVIDHARRSLFAPDGEIAHSFVALEALIAMSKRARRSTILGN